jgi:hypothetical protein
MTRRHHRDAADAFHVASADVDAFAGEVRKALKAAGRKMLAAQLSCTTRSIDGTVEDARRALRHANEEAYAERCEFLCRVAQTMVTIERIKLSRSPKDWLDRHFGPIEPPAEKPRRRHVQDEA